ncbi:MAG: TetR family transcriptional regulator [Rhodanobacter sp. 68-29]|uniref:TetR/AcrR family transcriptional regulator n=1 Tax=Rhodanobacter sp. PCA2 TaxID=2006117 RepID=UPI00086EB054|nr:TetR/AcrR family transcriptional regulator [Rhodanobacter sp. PCA2]MBA2078471.1 TetR family transcriptional regulator [Rhodanobacter sp. PCA2]MBN8921527.1 TetR family transcriptional regulator [Rhodanobacter sp.]ODU74944.1 MAG: TetR family transcriptional regulator [Rhodanobacter sp. SCN 69-32]OJY61461.1 MAG: TetR family transcriptional regulator [Rhodanobacter sp. 68-29]
MTRSVNRTGSTKERILGAAETLFAQRGFDGASLRQLTSAAGVNLAAVNYHFGSKEKLVEQVFRRRLDALNAHRLAALDRIADQPDTRLEDVLDAFIRPALELSHEGGGSLFMRVLARAFAEHDDGLRKFLSENYGHVMRQFTAEFARLLPRLSKEELYWRVDLMTGALTHAMSGIGMIQRKSDVSERAHREQTVQHLIRFAAAGLNAT